MAYGILARNVRAGGCSICVAVCSVRASVLEAASLALLKPVVVAYVAVVGGFQMAALLAS